MSFEQSYLVNFAKDKAELRKLAEEYHQRCEDYDRIICTGPIINGSITPANGTEIGLISKHARQVFKELSLRAPHLEGLWKEIQDVSRNFKYKE